MRGIRAFAVLWCMISVAAESHAAESYVDDRGSIWTLFYSGAALPDIDPLHETFRVTLGVDTDAYSLVGSFIDQVAIKVSSAVFARSLFDAPISPSAWTLIDGGLNSSSCSGSGSGFVCANSTIVLNAGSGVAIAGGNGPGVDLEWVFDVTVDNGVLFTAIDQASLKARYLEQGDPHVIGARITLVPEPQTYALLLAGLGLLGFTSTATRRRR